MASTTPLPRHDADLAMRAEADGTIRLLTQPRSSGSREAIDQLVVPLSGAVRSTELLPDAMSRTSLDGVLLPDDTALLGYRSGRRSVSVVTSAHGRLGPPAVIATGALEYDGPYLHVSPSGAASAEFQERQAQRRHRSRWVDRMAFRGVGASGFGLPVSIAGQVAYSEAGDGVVFSEGRTPTVRRISRAGTLGPRIGLDPRPLGSAYGHAAVAEDGTIIAALLARPRGHSRVELVWVTVPAQAGTAATNVALGVAGDTSTVLENFAVAAAGDRALVVVGADEPRVGALPELRVFEGSTSGAATLGHAYPTRAPFGARIVAHDDGSADLVWVSWQSAEEGYRLLGAHRSGTGAWDPQPTVLATCSGEITIEQVEPIPTGGAAVVATLWPAPGDGWKSVLVRTAG